MGKVGYFLGNGEWIRGVDERACRRGGREEEESGKGREGKGKEKLA